MYQFLSNMMVSFLVGEIPNDFSVCFCKGLTTSVLILWSVKLGFKVVKKKILISQWAQIQVLINHAQLN